MAVIIVDEDGQSFYSPPELDQFTYFRDYILKRTFKEFFALNPGAAEEGWVDVFSQAFWLVDDDQDNEKVRWDGNRIIMFESSEFTIDAQLRDWPDSPPQKPWTRYLRPSRIRFTIKNAGGGFVTRTCSALTYDGDSEFLENFDVGTVNLPDGFIFPIDPQAPIVGDNDSITRFQFEPWGSLGMNVGDKIVGLEFGYDPIARIDYTNIWRPNTLGITQSFAYTVSGIKNDGTPVLQLTKGTNDDFHAIWNGVSWDEYRLPVISGQSGADSISGDDFGNVHYFQNGTPGSFLRWSWNLSLGFYEQGIDWAPNPTDQIWSPSTGRMSAVDPNGYSHLVYRAREVSPFRYYVGHYYQDASGWHNEEIFDIGDNDIGDYPWHMGYCEHLDCAIDSYGKLHVFIELSMRDLISIWDLDPFVMYITNSQTGGWTSKVLAPWGLGNEAYEGRLHCMDIYIDRENNNYMTGIVGSNAVPLYFIEKEWSVSQWTSTLIQPGLNDNWQQSVRVGNFYHLLGDAISTGAYDIAMFQYIKYNRLNYEIADINRYLYPASQYVGTRVSWPNCSYFEKDGKPVLVIPGAGAAPEPGFLEQEINE